ncbi:MAG TPA: hypothetical protein VJ909_07120 [Prolixibacteraceae bacterium]|nr:hypothetical protein [Prolixibacteraceae bacterium]
MKQSEIIQLSRAISILDGKGSDRLKWAIYRTSEKIQKASTDAMKFIEEMKPKNLKNLQKEQAEILQKCKTNQERQTAMLNWSKASDLENELQKFTESDKYKNFIESNNEEFTPYPLTLEKEDLEGVELNNQTFFVLEKIGEGLDKVMEEIIKEEEKK